MKPKKETKNSAETTEQHQGIEESEVEDGNVPPKDFSLRLKSALVWGGRFGLVAGLVGGVVGVITAIVINNFVGTSSNVLVNQITQLDTQVMELNQRVEVVESDSFSQNISSQVVDIEAKISQINQELSGLVASNEGEESRLFELVNQVNDIISDVNSLRNEFRNFESLTISTIAEIEAIQLPTSNQTNSPGGQTTNNVNSRAFEGNISQTGEMSVGYLASEVKRLNTQLLAYQEMNESLEILRNQLRELEMKVTSDDQLAEEQNLAESRIVEESQLILKAIMLIGIRTSLELGIPYAGFINRYESLELSLPETVIAYAETGVTTLLNLQQEFEELVFKAIEAEPALESENTLQGSVWEVVNSLIRVRRMTESEGDSASAVLSRIQARLQEGDLNQVLELIQQLHPEVQSVLASWLSKVQARSAAIAVVEEQLTKLEM